MKKYFSLLLCACFFLNGFARTLKKDSFFVIKGKVLHPQQDFWEFAMTDFFGQKLKSVPIDKNGRFLQKVAITDPQDIFLLLNNDATIIFAVPGDTLDISWNEKDFTTSFKVTSSHPRRQKELDAVLEVDRKFKRSTRQLNQKIYDRKISDTEKFASLKAAFADEAATLAQYPMTINSKKIYCDTYFKYIKFLHSARLFPQYNLSYADIFSQETVDRLNLSFEQSDLNEEIFYQSPNYRDYLFNITRFYKPFTTTVTIGSNPFPKSNFTIDDCYSGMAFLGSSQVIKD
jgi:hypothetical protein